MEIAAILAVCAPASYAFSKPKALDFQIHSEVINLQPSYSPEFRVRQSLLKLLNRYDERTFDVVFSSSQEIYVRLLSACDDDLKCNYTAFHAADSPAVTRKSSATSISAES